MVLERDRQAVEGKTGRRAVDFSPVR